MPDGEFEEEAVAAARPAAVPARESFLGTRGTAAVIFVACVSVLSVAIYLKPAARGYGTHQQLGMSPCGLLVRTGLPCPSCGMTTAFSNTVRGRVWAAIYAQAGGFLLAVGTILGAVISGATLVAGRIPRVFRRISEPYYIFWFILLVTLGGWALRLAWGFADGSLPVTFVKG